MNNRVNYALIGFLVLFGLSLIGGFSYWMLKPSVDDNLKKYIINFDESVLGLNIDAPVKYRGISVGKVVDLSISPKNSAQIQVMISIAKTTPVKVDTAAKLTAQGITGLTYINLSEGSHLSKCLEVKKGDKFPIIKTVPSFFENFEKSLGNVSTRLSATLGRTEELLGTDNQKQMSLLLRRTANLMQQMEKLMDDETVAHIQQTAKNIDSITYKMDKLVPNVDKFLENSVNWENNISASLASISESYLTMGESMDEFKRAISTGEFNLKEISSDLIPTMNNSFLIMQELMLELKVAINQYNQSPSDIFFKREEIVEAPGEK